MYRKIIKVFLGSPGDLEEERRAAKGIVDEENANHANELGYHIDLVGWEDTVSQRRRAQDAINVDLDQCEYFVGLMWKKWGTPPGPDGHPYSSGFEEEYRRSVDRHERTGKPEISLLFKEIPSDDLLDVGRQLEKVLRFQKEINEEKKQYYQKFLDLRDFERRFRAIIAKFLKDQQLEDRSVEESDPRQPKSIEDKRNGQESGDKQSELFDANELEFIEQFIGKEQEGDNAFSAAEAARFRLLACSISQSGNDNIELGNHDANLIYRDLRHVVLSNRERESLLSTALESLNTSTVPLWHWLFLPDFQIRRRLPLRTLWGGERRRRNAFALLEKLEISPTDFEGGIDKSDFLKFWFSEGVPNDLVISALEYLGAVGDDGLEIEWERFIGSSEANISRAAVRSSARIKARFNATAALRFVAEHEGTDLGNTLSEELLANIGAIETDVLRECLNNRTKPFRAAIAAELLKRGALTKADAQLICESSEADIRYIGVRALAKLNPGLRMGEARNILVKPRKSTSQGLFSSPQDRDYPGEEAYENYKVSVLGDLPYSELLSRQSDESFYSTEATLALYLSHFKRVKPELVEHLLDGFEKFCAGRCAATEAEPSDAVYAYVKRNLIQSALEAFCLRAGKPDLATVRAVLDEHEIEFSVDIANFLSKYGQWEDAARVAKISGKMKYVRGTSILSIVDHSKSYQLAANVILKLGKQRIADVWNLDFPNSVRSQLVVQMTKKHFSAFDDQKIVDMLLWDNDSVRETVALKAVLCLSKARLMKLLKSYYEVNSSYYYNAIFWLDLGVSADRETSRRVALKELEEK
ncbi:DUF4062 domain-containing protein [Phaeobacter sp. JH20_36]|uniref:DUF4062 domain-containing protein n=1 Tax=unclassified Phaeobacter TaxID=2621772 RepID=UPI003A85EDDE